jgi:hypothetical protein
VGDGHNDQIIVIDNDQGESGASAAWREGFQRLDWCSVEIYTIKTFPCENGLCHSPRSGKG